MDQRIAAGILSASLRAGFAGCPECVSLSVGRARTPAGQPPGRRRYPCGAAKASAAELDRYDLRPET